MHGASVYMRREVPARWHDKEKLRVARGRRLLARLLTSLNLITKQPRRKE